MKEKIIDHLKHNMGRYVSGEALSDTLGVSRTAIWKHIKELKEEGYIIEASSKKGYMLSAIVDILNECEISQGLSTEIIGRKIYYFRSIDSTNKYAKDMASEGCLDGTVVVADTQTAGRGRLGRVWSSAEKKGIWMSVVLRPTIPPEEVQLITLGASVAVVSAIYTALGLQAGIKWPNDIILDGKKVCGILIEMSCEMEQVGFIVVGIGINVNHVLEDFPEGIRNTATSLKLQVNGDPKDTINRSNIIKKILEELERIYENIKSGSSKDIIDKWKKYSVTIGKQVRVTAKGMEYIGTATNITDDGKLVLTLADGSTHEVISGEVSVRGLLGYV